MISKQDWLRLSPLSTYDVYENVMQQLGKAISERDEANEHIIELNERRKI